MAYIVSGLLESNSLNNERGGFIQSTQNIFTFFMEHIMDAAMEYVARTDFDRSVHSTFINGRQHRVKASPDRCGVMAKLEQVRRLPIHNFFFSRKEPAKQLPVRHGIQHGIVGMNIRSGQLIQNYDNINIATMKVSRTSKGDTAYCLIECDGVIPESVINDLKQVNNVLSVVVVNVQEG